MSAVLLAALRFIGPYAIRFGMWCLQNPDKVENGLHDVHALVDAIHAAKTTQK